MSIELQYDEKSKKWGRKMNPMDLYKETGEWTEKKIEPGCTSDMLREALGDAKEMATLYGDYQSDTLPVEDMSIKVLATVFRWLVLTVVVHRADDRDIAYLEVNWGDDD